MSLSLEELRSRVLALPGDELLCSGCGAAILRFTETTSFHGAEFLPAADVRPDGDRYRLYCALCGTGATKAGPARGCGIETAEWSAMLVRSGSWTGWRALGGE